MKRLFYIAALAVIVTAAGFCEDRGGTPKAAQAGRAPGAKNGGGAPKNGGLPKAGGRLFNPANPIIRLYRATPEERDRALEKLPPKQQERVRAELERFDRMPPEQQEAIVSGAERLAGFPPEKRRAVFQSFQDFQRLPPDRKRLVGNVIRRLQNASEEQRNTFLNGRFLSDFSAEEHKIILDLSEIMQPAR